MLRDFRPDVLSTEGKPLLVLTNQSEPLEKPKRAQFSLRKALKLSSSGSEIPICPSKKTNLDDARISVPDIRVIPQKINLVPDIGPVRRGRVTFVADKSLHELEIEFTEWKTQQKHIVNRVDQLHSDMNEVKKAVFQAKWMLVGALICAGLMNSDSFMQFLLTLGAK